MGGLVGTGRIQQQSAIKGIERSAALEKQREQANTQLEATQDAKTTSMIGSGTGAAILLAPKAYAAYTAAPAVEAGAGAYTLPAIPDAALSLSPELYSGGVADIAAAVAPEVAGEAVAATAAEVGGAAAIEAGTAAAAELGVTAAAEGGAALAGEAAGAALIPGIGWAAAAGVGIYALGSAFDWW